MVDPVDRADFEERMTLALDAGQMGTFALDLTTQVLTRSLRHDQIFGYATLQPDWGTKDFFAAIVPEERAAVREAFDDATAPARSGSAAGSAGPTPPSIGLARKAGSIATPAVRRSGSWAS